MPPQSPLDRREFLHLGLTAGLGLSLSSLLRLRAAEANRKETSVIFVQLGGGPPQHETYDPKPNAPEESRGAYKAIPTALPGVHFCELLPKQAALAKHLAIVRSVTHHEASHIALHMVETGYFLKVPGNSTRGEMPSLGSIVTRVRGLGPGGLPGAVAMPKPFAYSGTHYLGRKYAPFDVTADPNERDFRIENLSLAKNVTPERVEERRTLLQSFDATRSVLDTEGSSDAIDAFQKRALDLITGDMVRIAFDVDQESATLRDCYGRNTFGQRLVLARRLAEAGVPLITIRMGDWDDHQDLAKKMKARAPMFDAGISALVQDLLDRGLNRRVLVVAMGEFGRTPRINGTGGRDHWPGVESILLSGGEYAMGQVIGATDSQGGTVTSAPYAPQSVLAMVYQHLGINPETTFADFNGRPRSILEDREPIRELL